MDSSPAKVVVNLLCAPISLEHGPWWPKSWFKVGLKLTMGAGVTGSNKSGLVFSNLLAKAGANIFDIAPPTPFNKPRQLTSSRMTRIVDSQFSIYTTSWADLQDSGKGNSSISKATTRAVGS
jgi:hypothetical protein